MAEQTHGRQEQDTDAIAHQLAQQALQGEEVRRQEMRRKVEGKAQAKKDEATGKVLLDDGRLVKPLAEYMQSASLDFTHVPDEYVKSNEYGKFKVRWVNKLDAWGEPSETEIGYHQRFGFEVIKDKQGKTLERREFVAMQGPPEGFAALLAKNARPGSDVYDQAFKTLEELADKTNRKAGYRAVDIVTAPEHGREPSHMVSFDK